MTCDDMADYFQRLRTANGAANIPEPPSLPDELMDDDDDEEAAAAIHSSHRVVVKNLNLKELRKELICITKV